MNKIFKYALHKLHVYSNSGALSVSINRGNYNYVYPNPLLDFPVIKNSLISIYDSSDFGPMYGYNTTTYIYTDYNNLIYTNTYNEQITTTQKTLVCNFIPGLPLEISFIHNGTAYTIKAYFFGYYYINIPNTQDVIIVTVEDNNLKIKASTNITLTSIKQHYNDKELYMLNNPITSIDNLNITKDLFVSTFIEQHTCVKPTFPIPCDSSKLSKIYKSGDYFILHYGKSIYVSKDRISWKPFYHQASFQDTGKCGNNVANIHGIYYMTITGNFYNAVCYSKDLQNWAEVKNCYEYDYIYAAKNYLIASSYNLYGNKVAYKISGNTAGPRISILKNQHLCRYYNNSIQTQDDVSKVLYKNGLFYVFPLYKELELNTNNINVYYTYYTTKDFDVYTKNRTFIKNINKPTSGSILEENWRTSYTIFDEDSLKVSQIILKNNAYYLEIRNLLTLELLNEIKICDSTSSYNATQSLTKSKSYYFCTIYNNSTYELYKINALTNTSYLMYNNKYSQIERVYSDSSIDFIAIAYESNEQITFINETETQINNIYNNNASYFTPLGGSKKTILLNYNNNLYLILGQVNEVRTNVYKSTDSGETWEYVRQIPVYNDTEYGTCIPRMTDPVYINQWDSQKTVSMPLRLYCDKSVDMDIYTTDMQTFTTNLRKPFDWTIDSIDGIAYGNNIYVAINSVSNETNNHMIKYSTNMTTWTKATYPENDSTIDQAYRIFFINSKFVVFPKYMEGYILTSTNGKNWTKQSVTIPKGYFDEIWKISNNILTIKTNNGGSFYSTDAGTTWTEFYDPSDNGHIMFINNKYWTYDSYKVYYSNTLSKNSKDWNSITFIKKGYIQNAIPINNYILLQQSESSLLLKIDTNANLTKKQKFIISKEI